MNQISVSFVNLFTRRRLGQAVLPALPTAGDNVYVRGLGYEVVNREWAVLQGAASDIVVVVRPHVDATGEQLFSYPGEEE
jgi:hypothetical protein